MHRAGAGVPAGPTVVDERAHANPAAADPRRAACGAAGGHAGHRSAHRIRRPNRPCIACSTTPTPRSRGRRCCRSPRFRSAPIPAARAGAGSTRPCRAGISKFRSRPRRAPRWRSSRSRATAAATRSGGRQARLARALLARRRAGRARACAGLAQRRARPQCGCGRSGRRPRRSCAPGRVELSQALSKRRTHPGDIVIREGTPPQPAPARAGHFLDRAL